MKRQSNKGKLTTDIDISTSKATVKRSRSTRITSNDSVIQEDFSDVNKTLMFIRQLKNDMNAKSTRILNLTLLEGIKEVKDLPPEEVASRIEDLVVEIVQQIMSNNSFELTVPSRQSTNQKYIEEIDRIVLGDKVSKRQFLNTSHVRKTAITTRVVQLIHEVVRKGIHITKRDLFYTDGS